MDIANDTNSTEIIHILADYQVTTEFIHSILAFDWERASVIHQFDSQFIKINANDSIHTLTWIRTANRTYSKYVLEFCLDTNSLDLMELIFHSTILRSKIDVNILCTDGLPFYFHMFNKCFSDSIRQYIFANAGPSNVTANCISD